MNSLGTTEIALFIVAFLSCVTFAYFLVKEIQKNNIVSTTARRIIKGTQDVATQRREQEEEYRRNYGNHENKNFFYKCDVLLEKSGIKKKFPIITTELFLLLIMVIVILGGFITYTLTNNWVYTFLSMILIGFAIYIGFYLLVEKNEKNIDDNLLQFIDLLESYSHTSNDIINIMDLVAIDLDEPLQSAIYQCVREARMDGDISATFSRLTIKINNERFSRLIQNIEECSRNNADYAKVIRRNNQIIATYMSEKEIRKSMANEARINIVIMLGIYYLCMKTITGFIDTTLMEFFLSSPAGIFLLVITFIIFLYVLWKMISMGRR